MSSFTAMYRRDSDADSDDSWNGAISMDITIILVAIAFCSMLGVGFIYGLRKYKDAQLAARNQLPQYNSPSHSKNSRGLSIDPPAYSPSSNAPSYYDEKSSYASTPVSPVPEIRITFPDDVDEQGRAVKGSVVIVKIGERGGVGLEPVRDEEALPRYERDGKRWEEVDMDLIGGLKEKEKREYL